MTTKYAAPKAIINHPAVEECTSGIAGGSDYKHDVVLREEWMFSGGRMAGERGGFFNNVEDFRFANPVRRATLAERLMPGCSCGASPESNNCRCD